MIATSSSTSFICRTTSRTHRTLRRVETFARSTYLTAAALVGSVAAASAATTMFPQMTTISTDIEQGCLFVGIVAIFISIVMGLFDYLQQHNAGHAIKSVMGTIIVGTACLSAGTIVGLIGISGAMI